MMPAFTSCSSTGVTSASDSFVALTIRDPHQNRELAAGEIDLSAEGFPTNDESSKRLN